MARRPLLCRLRLHRDRRVRSHDKDWVYRCRRCGRVQGRGPVFTLMGPGARGGGV